jgi:hypothetical protein
MKVWSVKVLFAVALISAGYLWGHTSATVVHAQGQVIATVPKDWGRFAGVMPSGYYIFEDSGGTVRFTSPGGELTGQINRK